MALRVGQQPVKISFKSIIHFLPVILLFYLCQIAQAKALPSAVTNAPNSIYPADPGINITIPNSAPPLILNYRRLPSRQWPHPADLELSDVQSLFTAVLAWIDARMKQLGPAGPHHQFSPASRGEEGGNFRSPRRLSLQFNQGDDGGGINAPINLEEAKQVVQGMNDAAEQRGYTEEVRVRIYQDDFGSKYALGWVQMTRYIWAYDLEGGPVGDDLATALSQSAER